MSAPNLSIEQVTSLALSLFGINVQRVSTLGSCQDANFKVVSFDGRPFVFKVSHSATTKEEIQFQNSVILHLANSPACQHIDFPLPQPKLKSSSNSGDEDDDELIAEVEIEGTKYYIRLLVFVQGDVLSAYNYFSFEVLQSFGAFVATITNSLSDLSHPSAARPGLQWDLRIAPSVISELINSVEEEDGRRQKLIELAARCEAEVSPFKSGFRTQIVHGDLAHYNVIAKTAENGRPFVSGVIDFGDAMESWVVGDLAVAILSGFASDTLPEAEGWVDYSALLDACHVARGFHKVMPLNENEVRALWALVVQRSIVNIVSIQNELLKDPTNEYNIKGLAVEWRMHRRIHHIPFALAQAAMCDALGVAPAMSSISFSGSIFESSLSEAEVKLVDLSTTSALLKYGNWSSPEATRAAIAEFIRSETTSSPNLFVVPYGIPRFYRTKDNSLYEPETTPLSTAIIMAPGTAAFAPADGELNTSGRNVVIKLSGDNEILLSGIIPAVISGSMVTKGQIVGHIAAEVDPLEPHLPPHISVQIRRLASSVHPIQFTSISMFPAWRHFLPNPYSLLGGDTSSLPNENDYLKSSLDRALLNRRQYVASVQEHYFRMPPQIERGFKEHMYDTSGRSYVDMVNNVAVLGHSPRCIYDASTKQMDLLNTNSRFIYDKLGAFAEKIISRVPAHCKDKLNVVMFVNSGSEATDLAMRVARTVVNERRRKAAIAAGNEASFVTARDTICLEGAYHGITTASDEISTTLNDNPRSRESRPPWIHLVPMPNAFRYNNSTDHSRDIVDYYGDFVTEKIKTLKAAGKAPLCFIAEPLSGNAGGVEVPYGYFKRVYEEVRAAGGLCIADEVQVGYGRLGSNFWGFQEHDVVPDLLTMAKAAGNGHPLGFVITSREIAAEFGADGSLFSSAGGGPVGCAIGMAVLDAIEKENLQENAKIVGEYLHEKLATLPKKYPEIVGCIQGHGFYQGIELSRRSTRPDGSYEYRPATREAYAICERLLELGIICHNTGDYSNVLKVKPPLCLNYATADHIYKAMDICLRGW